MDADKADAKSTFKATVDVVEWLGNEAYAYIPFEAPPEVQKQLEQLEHDLDGETLRTQLVISLDGASHIEAGHEADIWINAKKMHLFDPSTGENLTVDRSKAGVIPGDQGAAEAKVEAAQTKGAED
jgi:multiple sugar transport system ATP-binding protein